MEDLVINTLIERGHLTRENFTITTDLIDLYELTYCELNNLTPSSKPRERRYARKLAAMSFVKFKKSLKFKLKEGFVYIISNPAWEGKYKIGISHDPKSRLRQYQTYSPDRDYKLEHYSFWLDTREVEKLILSQGFKYKNEWVLLDKKELIKLCSILNNYSKNLDV
tara:strand:- start:484 stop:981 length:498 start_codon:yes stop_codon:yes gene_type:complete